MEDVLVDAYLHHHNIGNRQGGAFTSIAIDNILKEMKEHFPDKQLDKQKIKRSHETFEEQINSLL